MGKVGKTFTIDHELYTWLANHAKKEGKKESYIINAMLNNLKRQYSLSETWSCPECNATNTNRFTDCHGCDYILPKS